MKGKIRRLFSTLTACFLILTVMTPMVGATVLRSSDYFWSTSVVATPSGNGNLVVEIDVNATRTMKELGASKITIYEQQSTGRYSAVKTFTRDNTSSLITENTAVAYARVSYKGVRGVN